MSRLTLIEDELQGRSGGYCEAGGAPLGACQGERHPRKRRGRGGDRRKPEDTPANVLMVCRRCHRWIHAHPAVARDHGLIVRENQDPADVPVRVIRGLCTQR